MLTVLELAVRGTSDKFDAVKIDESAWASIVGMSAVILTRDFGSRSHQEALRRSNEYEYEENERASGLRLTEESFLGFPSVSAYASLVDAHRGFDRDHTV